MKLLVGLGNPGPKYETTRHNVGFLALDYLASKWKADGPKEKFKGEMYSVEKDTQKLLLVKPQTFMNLSGDCVSRFMDFYKLEPEDLTVLYDDVDLPSHTLKIKSGGGTGGHNGIRSIDDRLGAIRKNYYRLRIGVGRSSHQGTADHVLEPFDEKELSQLESLFDLVEGAVELLLAKKLKEAMNQYNRKGVE